MPPTMPSKSKVREEEEDVSQLRKPIIIHGKPVEQILNSIHYGSPELRSLLLNECDIIFECKVCRALFRDLPNFIAHKRRFCSKSAAENNHFAISELPDEKVVVVQPRAPADTKPRAAKTSAQSALSASSGKSVEETVQRISYTEGNSHASKLYSNIEAKLRHQRDHAKISTIRTTEIPGNSNAVFISVNNTSVNIHERAAMSKEQDTSNKVSLSSKRTSRKSEPRSRSLERPNLRSKSCNKTAEESTMPSDLLMKELKVMQNRLRSRAQCPKEGKETEDQDSKDKLDTEKQDIEEPELVKRLEKGRKEKFGKESNETKTATILENLHLKLRVHPETRVRASSKEKDGRSRSMNNGSRGSVGTAQQNTDLTVVKIEKDLSENPSKLSADCSGTSTKCESKLSKRSLICMKCRSIFSSKRSLQFHMKMQHSGNKMFFPCPLCSNIYCYVQAVRRHLQLNHNKSKLQIKALQGEIKSRVFTKFAPSQSQESVRSAKRTLSGTRHSLRYKDKAVNKESNNAPYLYSLVKTSKGVSAKKDPILQSSTDLDSSSESSMTSPTPKPNATHIPNFHNKKGEDQKSHLKSTRSLAKSDSPGVKGESKSQRHHASPGNKMQSLEEKPSIELHSDALLQTCKKCSRLFGRKSTFEKHVKICDGKPNELSVDKKLTPGSRHSAGNNSISVRNRSKENRLSTSSMSSTDEAAEKHLKPMNIPVSCALPTLSTPADSKSSSSLSKIENCDSLHHAGIEFHLGTSQLQEKCHDTLEDDTKSTSNESESSRSTVDLSSTVTRLKSKLSHECSRLRSEEFGQVASSEASSSSESKGQEREQRFSHSECGKGRKSGVFALSQGVETEVHGETTASAVSNAFDRPRRKRKVPSRNIGAVEFLKKIHRLEEDGQSPKSAKIASELNNSPLQLTSSQQSKPVSNSKALMKKARDERNFPGSVSRNRATGNRVFVLKSNDIGRNRSKLHCYNYSKVQKLMDQKNISCLKCGSKFSFIHNLKRHIVRVHLQWSRFQCKLCNFNCFDKSECNTHIIRCHRKGQKLERNHFFNTLIIDLAQKGNEALSQKKTKAIKAKSQLQEKEEDIYRNQNAQKVPRLSERTAPKQDQTLSGDCDGGKKQLRTQHRGDSKRDVLINGASGQTTSPQTATSAARKSLAHAPISQKISHLVERTPRACTSHSIATTAVSENMLEDSGNSNTANTANLNPKLSTKEQTAQKTVPGASPVTLTSTSAPAIKRAALPFNISTRNSPRVFDTTPYNREETVTVKSNNGTTTKSEVVLLTRHGSYAKLPPEDPVKEKTKSSPASLSDGGVPRKKENFQFKEELNAPERVEDISDDNDDDDDDDAGCNGFEEDLIPVKSANTNTDTTTSDIATPPLCDRSSATDSKMVTGDDDLSPSASISSSKAAVQNFPKSEMLSVPASPSARISNTKKTPQQDSNYDQKTEIFTKESS